MTATAPLRRCSVARWDLDKTYLRSDFHTIKDMWAAVMERPDQKRAIAGAAALMAELREAGARIHVLSGSPEQMRSSIMARFRLDGVPIHELTLKPNLQNLLRLRLRALKDQLGYKLPSLLAASFEAANSGTDDGVEILIGDDSEADALVYALYMDVRSGALDALELQGILEHGDLYRIDLERTLTLARRMRGTKPASDFVALLHLERQTPPSHFQAFGGRLVPFFNYAQAALVLLDRGLLSSAAAQRVGAVLVSEHRFDLDALARSYWDLRRRKHTSPDLLEKLQADPLPLGGTGLSWADAILRDPLDAQPIPSPETGRSLDYVALVRAQRRHAQGP